MDGFLILRIISNYESALFFDFSYSFRKNVENALWNVGFYLVITESREAIQKVRDGMFRVLSLIERPREAAIRPSWLRRA